MSPMLALIVLLALTIARISSAESVTLEWRAPGDDGDVGTASAYVLKSSTAPLTEQTFAAGVTRPTPLPQIAGTMQSTVVTDLEPLTTYYFAIKAVDDAGNWSAISNVVPWTTGTVPADSLPPDAPTGLHVQGPIPAAPFSVPIAWINPSEPIDGVGGQRCFSLNPADFQTANVWANADRTIPKAPGTPGRPDMGYIWCDGTPPNAPGEPIRFRLRVRKGTRWSVPSNDVIAQVVPAGQYFLARRDVFATCFTEPVWDAQGVVSWSLAAGDSGRAEIVSKTYVNAIEQPHVCGELLHFWSPLVRQRVCP